MLAAAIMVKERFFMEVSYQAMVSESLFEHLHQDHVVIDCLACIFEERAKLELVGCHFLVPCLARNPNFQQFSLSLLKCLLYNFGQFAVVVVGKLLVFRCRFPQ